MQTFHILTLFAQMVDAALDASIIGRARAAGTIAVDAVDIREYSLDPHHKADDYPYGGGAGLVMLAQPVFDCADAVMSRIADRGGTPVLIYLAPCGEVFTQSIARTLSAESDLVFVCGHYEGIDERAVQAMEARALELGGRFMTLSLGDFVLTGGEPAAIAMVDSISRLIPGVLHNETSPDEESFSDNLLEYPQYTRPEEWRGMTVPDVLLSGHHANIKKWRLEESETLTQTLRPDLFKKHLQSLDDCDIIP